MGVVGRSWWVGFVGGGVRNKKTLLKGGRGGGRNEDRTTVGTKDIWGYQQSFNFTSEK